MKDAILTDIERIEAELAEGPLKCEWPMSAVVTACPGFIEHVTEWCDCCKARPAVAAHFAKREAGLLADHQRIEGEQFEYWSARLAESRAEVKAAMAVLTPSMPESGLVDACRQVKQAAISWRDNRAAVDAENAALREELELLRQELSMRLPIPMAGEKWWSCLIGPAHPDELPGGADAPMREAVGKAFKILTGTDDLALFSGWGDHPNEPQRAVIANTTISETRALAALDFWRAGRMG